MAPCHAWRCQKLTNVAFWLHDLKTFSGSTAPARFVSIKRCWLGNKVETLQAQNNVGDVRYTFAHLGPFGASVELVKKTRPSKPRKQRPHHVKTPCCGYPFSTKVTANNHRRLITHFGECNVGCRWIERGRPQCRTAALQQATPWSSCATRRVGKRQRIPAAPFVAVQPRP